MFCRSAATVVLVVVTSAACGGTGEAEEPASPTTAPPATTVAPVTTTAAGPATTTTTAAEVPNPPLDPVEQLLPVVLSVRPHDTEAFTQGLLIEDGRLFESTGLYGRSTLREVDPATGDILRSVALDDSLFGEGVDLVGDRLVMLTYQEGTALVFERDTFELVGEFSYDSEGWGLCYDGQRLVMSDGTESLVFRDPETFAETGRVAVTIGGELVERINELECVDGAVWANIWYTDFIYRIDPSTGEVTGVVDAGGLLESPLEDEGAVLNGIAYDETTQTWLVTGKLWPAMFEVRFVPDPGSS